MKESEFTQLKHRIETLEREVAALKKRGYPYRGIRKGLLFLLSL